MPIHNNNDSLSMLPLKANILLFMNNRLFANFGA